MSSPIEQATERAFHEMNRWAEDVIVANTPHWMHVLAMAAQHRGLRWMHYFPVPLIRRLSRIEVRTTTNMHRAPDGFRKGAVSYEQTIRIYKRKQLLSERTFRFITNSPYSKLL